MAESLKVTLVRSIIGRPAKHRKVVTSLGLTKLNRSNQFKDSPAIRGMIKKVSHLLSVEEINA